MYFVLFVEYIDDEGIRWTLEKCRPSVALINFYNISWKPRNNHFNRYTDVKPKGKLVYTDVKPKGKLDNTDVKPKGKLVYTDVKPKGKLDNTDVKPKGKLDNTDVKPKGGVKP